jgi:SAM-dependent methyltransferase
VSYFRTQAAQYARSRPDYPEALFEAIAALCPHRSLAWDCATGNGQAAISIARHFEHVVATDISAEQIAHSRQAANIEYRIADASASGLDPSSVDLVSVFQAIHWLDLSSFYPEVNRVLRQAGVFVAATYPDPVIADDPPGDQVLQHFNKVTVGSYWPKRRAIIDRLFDLPFPFEEIPIPRFELTRDWDLSELSGYLRSWSATNRYVAQHADDPVIGFESAMKEHWPEPTQRKRVQWPFLVRVGRKIS